MNWRKLVILAVALVALIGVGRWLQWRDENAASSAVAPVSSLVPSDLSLKQLTEIELSAGTSDVVGLRAVRTESGPWQIATAYNIPADESAIEGFLGALREIEADERARGAQWYSDFGVGEDGLRVQLREKERTVVDLVIGRGKKTPTLNFVRRHDGETIYACSTDILGTLRVWEKPIGSLSPQLWAELKLFPSDIVSQATQIEIAERTGDGWTVRAEHRAPWDKLPPGWIERLKAARAERVLEPEAASSGFAPQWKWTLKTEEKILAEAEEDTKAQTVRLSDAGPCFSSSTIMESLRQELLPKENLPAKKPAPKKK